MALDDTSRDGGGDECWRCGGSGWAGEWLGETEARHLFGEDIVPKNAGFESMHTTQPCPECDTGRNLARLMND